MPKKKERIVRHNFDPENPPVLTVEQKEEMKALSEMSDKDIDYSDIPPMDEAKHWHKAANTLHSIARLKNQPPCA